MGFRKKVVLITGATSVIGEATALTFARESANLVLTGRCPDKLKDLAEKCDAASIVKAVKPLWIAADITKDEDIKVVVNEVIKYYGKLDVLVNNAGDMESFSNFKSEMEVFDETFLLNVRSIYHLTMLLAPLLIESKGCVINVSSALTASASYFICYSMAKSALDNFTTLAARKLGPKGVRINSVNPGNVQLSCAKSFSYKNRHTSMIHINLLRDEKLEDPLNLKLSNKTAVNKSCEVDEVANAVVYLASDQTKNLTGAKIMIDNGLAFTT